MVAAFSSPFVSLAGQKERLANVVEVLKISLNPFSKDKVQANVGSPTGKAALEFVANNPYSTAAVVAGAPAVGSRAAAAFSSAKLTTQVGVSAAALVATPTLLTSERARVGVISAASSVTPEKLVKFGSEAGKVIDAPSVKATGDLFRENPGVAAAGALLGAAIIGKVAVPSVTTALNTQAIRANTKATQAAAKSIVSDKPLPSLQPPPASAAKAPADVVTKMPTSVTPDTNALKVSKVSSKRKTYKQKRTGCDRGKWKFLFKAQQR